jgi:TctA family transporter
MSDAFVEACFQVFGSADVWLIVIGAAVYGVFVGAIPGLTATMAVALFVPMTYWLDPVPALAAIVTMVACAIFAGDIPTVLLRIPGTPASAAYADEAYAFTRRGQSDRPLSAALMCSVVGGIFGSLVLMLLGAQLAKVATLFSVAEYFWLYLLGLTCAVLVSRGSAAKAVLSLMIGLLLSTVGLSAVHVEPRFTFGRPELFQGISFIPAMIGLFGFSEVLRNLATGPADAVAVQNATPTASGGYLTSIWRMFVAGVRLVVLRKTQVARSSTIGVLVGMLPGAGADIAAWISLAASKRLRRTTTEDTASEEPSLSGIADATAANNAALAGSWIPALVFGIPGDSVTAIVIGVLLMKNVTPGPKVFAEQASLVYSIYLLFLLANLVLLPVGLAAIKLGGIIVRVPRRLLLPVIVLFCVTGAYALNGSMFDVGVMLAMGVLGFVLERRGLPLGPVVLGILLGGPLEERFIQALTGAGGSVTGLVNRPVAALFACVCTVLWTVALLSMRQKQTSR